MFLTANQNSIMDSILPLVWGKAHAFAIRVFNTCVGRPKYIFNVLNTSGTSNCGQRPLPSHAKTFEVGWGFLHSYSLKFSYYVRTPPNEGKSLGTDCLAAIWVKDKLSLYVEAWPLTRTGVLCWFGIEKVAREDVEDRNILSWLDEHW